MLESILELDALGEELNAAFKYFGESEKDDLNNTLLGQITRAVSMVKESSKIQNNEVRNKQLKTVSIVIQNLHMFKIAETGTDLFGKTPGAITV